MFGTGVINQATKNLLQGKGRNVVKIREIYLRITRAVRNDKDKVSKL